MSERLYEDELLTILRKLSANDQRRVLEFAKSLNRRRGTPGHLFLERTKDISISKEDLAAMERAIEEACEVIEDFPDAQFDA